MWEGGREGGRERERERERDRERRRGWEAEMGEERTNDLHQVDWLEFSQESKIVKICIVPQRVVLGRKWPGVESLDIVDSRLRNVSGK